MKKFINSWLAPFLAGVAMCSIFLRIVSADWKAYNHAKIQETIHDKDVKYDSRALYRVLSKRGVRYFIIVDGEAIEVFARRDKDYD